MINDPLIEMILSSKYLENTVQSSYQQNQLLS